MTRGDRATLGARLRIGTMRTCLLSLTLGLLSCDPEPAPDDTAPFASHIACVDPQPILDELGQATGYVTCADGAINRAAARPVDMERYAASLPGCTSDDPEREVCTTDADCSERANGHCAGVF